MKVWTDWKWKVEEEWSTTKIQNKTILTII